MKTSNQWNTLQPSYIREILQAATGENIISLAGGLPATDLLPNSLLQKALLSLKPDAYQYGTTEGAPALREYLHHRYTLSSDQAVIITSGSQQGLDLIARTFVDSDSEIVMEQPCYLGALQVFQLTRCRIHSVEQCLDGPDLNQLEQLFRSRRIKLFYCVPDFHNPTGLCWSEECRYKVAALCRKYAVTLIEDAPYRELRFSGKDLPMLSHICPEQCLTLRSFSKILSPGIRLGSLSGPKRWLDKITRLKQAADLHTATPFQLILPTILKSSAYADHLQTLRDRYRKNHNTLIQALTYLSVDTGSIRPVAGGMFLWLRLKKGNASEVSEQALKRGLALVPGTHFYPAEGPDKALRLNFSHCREEQLIKASEILIDCLT